jgi:hypothetical protein
MVTAGVYLLIRCSPLIEQSELAISIIMVTGAVTAFFAASVGLFQNDIKKVIAYSTMSQLAREYILFNIFRHQTICVGVITNIIINSQITKTHNYSHQPPRGLATEGLGPMFPRTIIGSWKDSIYNYISNIFFNSSSAMRQYWFIVNYKFMSERWKIIIESKLVGISVAIRLILIINLLKIKMSYWCSIIFNKYSSIKFSIFNIYWYIYIERIYIYILNIKTIFNNSISFENIIILPKSIIYYLLYLAKNITYFIPFEDNNNTLKSNIIPDYTPGRWPGKGSSPWQSHGDDHFFEWLAGVIDGDGYFNLSKGGTARLTITMDIRDKSALYEIKHKLGGSIYTIANANALRFQLSHKKGLIILINGVNGLIRNPARLIQMNKLCLKYKIEILYPKPLTFNNGWLSGFIDSDGSIYMNETSGQVFISASQKNKYLLEPLIHLYGGRVDIHGKVEAFKYIVYRKNELYNLIDNYFNKYPLRTKKASRLKLIKQFYLARISKNNKDIEKLNKWVLFKDKWEKYID